MNRGRLQEAIDLAIAILEDLETEIEWSSVSNGGGYRAALESAQQLLETLQAAGEEQP